MNETDKQEQRVGLAEAARSVYPDRSKGVAFLRKAISEGSLSATLSPLGGELVLLSEVRGLENLPTARDIEDAVTVTAAEEVLEPDLPKRGGRIKIK